MRLRKIPILLVLILLTSACAGTSETIKDIRDIKQDNLFYIDKTAADRGFLTADDQKKWMPIMTPRFFPPGIG